VSAESVCWLRSIKDFKAWGSSMPVQLYAFRISLQAIFCNSATTLLDSRIFECECSIPHITTSQPHSNRAEDGAHQRHLL
jgi:hypothetical protein